MNIHLVDKLSRFFLSRCKRLINLKQEKFVDFVLQFFKADDHHTNGYALVVIGKNLQFVFFIIHRPSHRQHFATADNFII